jgi:hypothetical protein
MNVVERAQESREAEKEAERVVRRTAKEKDREAAGAALCRRMEMLGVDHGPVRHHDRGHYHGVACDGDGLTWFMYEDQVTHQGLLVIGAGGSPILVHGLAHLGELLENKRVVASP